ncbi:Transposon Ty3-I Gag-Pol polyprotein [Vitis vinifera]|uniref:Transposon Ty3-I Gag-Pol polyprotein n=1 Tax=Vitis vinifera TaxID=29760 RepID=A0A438IVY2_VITVI|nr:Transposon Ty3-I Gag-Pol polyprotein [Vitis vinifera]
MKRFGQAVLQVEACSMNVVLQIFKRSICPGTPFFESLAKKLPTTMDDLFRRANKYSMLEDDVRAATQQVLVVGRPSRGDAERNAKPPDRPRLSDRRWLRPQGTDPSTRDHSKRCVFHKEHGHTTETCRSLQYLVEKLIKTGHLKQYLRSDTEGKVTSQHHNPGAPKAPAAPKGTSMCGVSWLTQAARPTLYKHRSLATWDTVSQALKTLGKSCPDSTDHQLRHWETLYYRSKLAQSLNVQFSVVQELSPFNIILGHTWLHYMKVIPSTYHQMDPSGRKLGAFTSDRQTVIRNEVDKLLEAGFIREVAYPDWLANVVVVPKKEGKWRVCVDYTNLNNACPKDSFPLPRIDQIVDSTSGQGMLSFLDAFSGYHQIPMSPDDEEKTAFITPHDFYCHTVEVYIDDIMVKSKTREQHVLHLQEVFHLLRKYGMKLNPSKCAFSVSAGKFMGFMVIQRGIEVSPDQVKAVMETPPPKNKKELQRLTGKLVTLGRFIARFTDELRPFFLAIRKAGAHGWTDSCQNAFEKIKHCFMQPPILSSPSQRKNCTCIWRYQNGQSTPFYSAAPHPRTLRSAAQKLRPYFQAHPVIVLTYQPLRNILHKPDLTGRMLQWVIELSEFGIEFQPRLSIKGQVMADFVLEYSRRPSQHHESIPNWGTLEQAIRLRFSASNNEAEYEVILSGLDLALALSVSKLRIYSDSQLVVRHVQKEYEAKDARMARYLAKVRNTLQQFTEWTIEKIKRADNGRTDALAGIAASLPIKEAILLPIYVQTNLSVVEISTCNTIEANQADHQEWTYNIAEYLRTGTLPGDLKQAHKV